MADYRGIISATRGCQHSEKLPPPSSRRSLRRARRRGEASRPARNRRCASRHRGMAPAESKNAASRGDRVLRSRRGRLGSRPRCLSRSRRDRVLTTRQEMTLKRGEIYWADLWPRSGSEQAGRRPVLVVSHDGFNATPGWRSVIVVLISTAPAQAGRGPTAVPLPAGSGGLNRKSVALCHQVTTLDRAKLTRRVGALASPVLDEVAAGLKAALDLEGA